MYKRYQSQVYYDRLTEFGSLGHTTHVPRLTSIEIHWNQRDYGLDLSARAGCWAMRSRCVGSRHLPVLHRSEKSVAALRLRQGALVGTSVRRVGTSAYSFLDGWLHRVCPRIRPWAGYSVRHVDRRGNRTVPLLGITMFQEVEWYYELFQGRASRTGLSWTIHTNASSGSGLDSDVRARGVALLSGLGFPLTS